MVILDDDTFANGSEENEVFKNRFHDEQIPMHITGKPGIDSVALCNSPNRSLCLCSSPIISLEDFTSTTASFLQGLKKAEKMLATATPFNIMDENLGVIKKPGNNKTVKKAVFFDENAVGAQTPTMVQKPGLAPKSSTRRALGDLNSNQLNQRTPIATKSGAIGSELKKSGLKPMPSSSKSSLKGSGTSSNAPKTADAATKPAIVPATEVEEEFDVV